MEDNEIIYDLNLVTPEDKKKLDEQKKISLKNASEILDNLTNKTKKSDGTIEINWFMDSEHIICEKEKAFYKATKIILPNGVESINIEEYLNPNMSSDY